MYTKTIFELLNESSRIISSEIELENVVQRVTDIGTSLAGAEFGAFFYNTVNQEGESLVLYTISGVDKEAFSKFPMPRNTKIFEPTFMARGTVRYDDVTTELHYGQNPPYEGMPKGHLPVRSYLAVPVVSPVTKEPIGGLFFGHSEPGVFTSDSEKLIEGVAIQAAIALSNARFFEDKKQTERILSEQREQYRSIFNATSDSAIIYDENGYIVEANPSACSIFDYEYNDLIGRHASALFKNPQDFELLKEIALSGRVYKGVNTRIRKDGSEFEAEYKGLSFIFRGKPHVLSVVRDETTKIKAEEALHRNEELTNIITSVSPVALWLTNNEGETIYFNKTWEDWVGGQAHRHLGQSWLEAVVPEDREMVRSNFLEAFNNRKIFTTDFRIKRRSGELRWCSSHSSPYFNKDGSFGGFAGSLADITERKVAEEKLQSQNVLISTITNNTQQALFLMNDRQYCTYMNPAAEQMIGYKLEEVQEKPLHYYIHHTHPDGSHFPIEDCAIDRALPTKNQTQGEEVFIHKDGRFFPVAFTASPIIDNGVPVGTVIEARDTTIEKRIQEELRNKEKIAMSMLEAKVKERTIELENTNYELLQFTSVASHDLKEPVRKISIFSKLLKDRLNNDIDEGTLRYLNNIISSSERMAQLIDDLLSFSRLSHTQQHFESADLNNLLQQIISDLEIPIREKQASIQYNVLPVIKVIPLQLGQVFQNLISNSLKFAHPQRRPLIKLEARSAQEENKPVYIITYQDNGIGFKPEQADKIFDVFYRLHSKDEYEGTGVGLAIVKKIIEQHGGRITAEGKVEEGARFTIVLPR